MSPRALALPPAERRAALVTSARDLVRQRGRVPSTKEIAEAAGVAEGTIFRVFETKDALVDAIIDATFCPAVFQRGLDEIDLTQPLRARLVAFVALLQQRFTDVFDLMGALGLSAPPSSMRGHHERCTPEQGHVESHVGSTDRRCAEPPEVGEERMAAISRRLVDVDASTLRCTPAQLVTYLRLLTFSGSHPHISHGDVLTPGEIVEVVLRGVEAVPAPEPSTRSSRKAH